MSKNQEQLDIEVDINEVPKKDSEIKVEIAEEPVSKTNREIEPEEGLENLKAQLEAEKHARFDAEKRAYEASANAVRASNEVQEVNLHLMNSAIETIRQNSEILKANYRDAMTIQDYDRAASIQHEMTVNSSKLLDLEQGKVSLEQTPKKQVSDISKNSNPVEALASQLTPRSANWIRKNPQYATNPKLYQKMVAAHQLVTNDDIETESDEYFEKVESLLGIRQNYSQENYQDPTLGTAKTTQKRSSPPAAPVSRGGNGTGSRPNVVRLTADQRDAAKSSGLTDEEYARHLLELRKEGKIN